MGRLKLVAALAVALAVGSGCSSDERQPTAEGCRPGAGVSLCVTVGGTTRTAQRLADSAARTQRLHADPATRLVALPAPDDVLALSMQPARALKVVELDLHRSVSGLGRESPILSVECATTCGRWTTKVSDDRRIVRVPATDVRPGYVLVVAAFVETSTGIEQVSWGLVFRTPA